MAGAEGRIRADERETTDGIFVTAVDACDHAAEELPTTTARVTGPSSRQMIGEWLWVSADPAPTVKPAASGRDDR